MGTGDVGPASAAHRPFTTPSAPFSVSSAILSGWMLQVSWQPPATDGYAAVTHYVVEYSHDATTWYLTNDQPVPGDASVIVMNLTATPIRFRVAAVNVAGSGEFSSPSAIVTPVDSIHTAPAMATGVSLAATRANELTATWVAPAVVGSDPNIVYKVDLEEQNADGVWSPAASSPYTTPNTTLVVSSLTTGTTLRVRVAASSSAGVAAFTAYTSALVESIPDAPTSVAATVSGGAVATIALSWAAAGDGNSSLTGWTVEMSTNAGAWVALDAPAANTSELLITTESGKSYTLRVAAVNRWGTSPTSSVGPLTAFSLPDRPNAPTLAVSPGVGKLLVTWNRPADGGSPLTKFLLEASLDGRLFSTVWEPQASETQLTLTETPGTVVAVRIAAVNAAGRGGFSTQSVSVTAAEPPSPPATVVVSTVSGGLTVSWPGSPANGYAPVTAWRLQLTPSSSANSIKSVTLDGTARNYTALLSPGKWTVSVAADNAAGRGTWSTASSVTEVVKDICTAAATCSGHGTCRALDASQGCACDTHYFGANCGSYYAPKATTQSVVDTAGGSVALASGHGVELPAAALSSNVAISVSAYSASAQPPSGTCASCSHVSDVLDLGPDGTTFTTPVTVKFSIGAGTTPAGKQVHVHTYDTATQSWEPLTASTTIVTDASGNRVASCTTTHFSLYSAMLRDTPSSSPSPTTGDNSETMADKIDMTLLVTIGAGVGVLLLAIVLIVLMRRHRRTRRLDDVLELKQPAKQMTLDPSYDPYASPHDPKYVTPLSPGTNSPIVPVSSWLNESNGVGTSVTAPPPKAKADPVTEISIPSPTPLRSMGKSFASSRSTNTPSSVKLDLGDSPYFPSVSDAGLPTADSPGIASRSSAASSGKPPVSPASPATSLAPPSNGTRVGRFSLAAARAQVAALSKSYASGDMSNLSTANYRRIESPATSVSNSPGSSRPSSAEPSHRSAASEPVPAADPCTPIELDKVDPKPDVKPAWVGAFSEPSSAMDDEDMADLPGSASTSAR